MSGKSRLVVSISILWSLFSAISYMYFTTMPEPIRWQGFWIFGFSPSALLLIIWWVYLGFKKDKESSKPSK